MTFNEKNRKLESKSGYLREKESGAVYDYAIFLGKFDNVDNYEEITAAEFETAKAVEEENANAQNALEQSIEREVQHGL